MARHREEKELLMDYKYKIVPKKNMSARPAPGTSNTAIGQLSVGVAGYGNTLQEFPDGSKWLFVEAGAVYNGKPVQGWVAIIHNGEEYCTLTTIGEVPPPPPPSNVDIQAITVTGEITADKKLRVFITDPNNLPVDAIVVNGKQYGNT